MPQIGNPNAEGGQMEQEKPVQIYANAVQFTLGAFDAFLEFALNAPKETTPKPLVRVHMSIEHAWVMAKIMDRIFADFRMKGGKFTIPPEVLNQLGLTDEYREDMGS
jgi:hypothetical protein